MTADNKTPQQAGETKSIRFEKDVDYSNFELWNYFDEIPMTHFSLKPKTNYWRCIKSFTVQINIIEDEQN